MPVITQNFHHTMESLTAVKAGVYNYTGSLATVAFSYKEPSELFWQDLKSVLQEAAGLEFEFNEYDGYVASKQAPSFGIWGLEFSPMVFLMSSHASSYCLTPMIVRHYEYSPFVNSFKWLDTVTTDVSSYMTMQSRINQSNSNALELDYTIEVRYNEDFLLIEYRPYADKTIKFTLCCLIKGTDINDKVVVYESGGCNTYSTTAKSSSADANQWPTYHKLVWPESPKVNPYTSSHSYPSNACYESVVRSGTGQGVIFMDLINNTYAPHTSRISLYATDEKNVLFQKPICCWGRVNFSDNILTGPLNLTVNTDYEIDGKTYYCPGDYVTERSMSAGNNYTCYGMKFLLKL